MQTGQATRAVDEELVTSAYEQAAVAELMVPSESPLGRPPLYRPKALCLALILASPSEPEDPDDE